MLRKGKSPKGNLFWLLIIITGNSYQGKYGKIIFLFYIVIVLMLGMCNFNSK